MITTPITQPLADVCLRLQEVAQILGASDEGLQLKDWLEDLNDPFKIVVLGEFNRGKTSVLNALFGISSLPVGVLPTTSVVTVLRSALVAYANVHNHDGTVTRLPWSSEAIAQYVGSKTDLTLVDFVEIGYPHPLLQAGAIFVDTPGVSDLNNQRVEVTYRYVPRADAVLFLLDSTTPVTQSEMNFLQSTVLEVDGTKLLFLANFIDLLDEDERKDAVDTVSRRIRESVGRDCEVIAISAKEAQQPRGADEGSGLPDLTARLTEIIRQGQSSKERLARFRARLKPTLLRLMNIAEERIRLCGLREEHLQDEIGRMSEGLNQRLLKGKTLALWLRDREDEVLAMTAKSLVSLGNDVQEDILDQLNHYGGSDFSLMVTTQVPITVKRRMKGWIDSHSPALQQVLQRINRELTSALSREFKTSVPPLISRSLQVDPEAGALSVSMPKEFLSPRSIAGIIGGGAAILVGVATGGLLTPIATMIATPLIAEHLSRNKVEAQKLEHLPNIREAISASSEAFGLSVLNLLRGHFRVLGQAAEERFSSLAEANLRMAQEQLETRGHDRNESRSEIEDLQGLLIELQVLNSTILI